MTTIQRVSEHLQGLGFLYISEYDGSDGRYVAKFVHPVKGAMVLVERFSARSQEEKVQVYIATKGGSATMWETLNKLAEEV